MNKINFDNKTRGSALSTVNSLASKLNFWQDNSAGEAHFDCKIEDLLYKPYALKSFDESMVREYLDMLEPDRSFVVYRSKKNA
jgi:hypothetical protein